MKRMIFLELIFLFLSSIASGIRIEKSLLYNQHTLQDTYTYAKTARCFQWEKMAAKIDTLYRFQEIGTEFGALNNYKNRNGKPPVADSSRTDAYRVITDKYGVKRDQSIPFYRLDNLSIPECYGRDGMLVWILRDTAEYLVIVPAFFSGVWLVPAKYVDRLSTRRFRKIVVVDCMNQNAVTLEETDSAWLVRSMNPVTTGVQRPPFKRETPLGVYVIRTKLQKMPYLRDGGGGPGGFAPWASRFSGGAYLHGVPSAYPKTKIYEFSWSLGTSPRSHMCVRNATSHAKFIYDWAPVGEALVMVIN